MKMNPQLMRHSLSAVIALASLITACNGPKETDINQGWTFWSSSHPEKVVLNLPHDAMQTEERSADASCGNAGAYFPGGIYHYEKVLKADRKLLDSHVTLCLEGVYQKSKVFVNGVEAGGCTYGYTGYEACLDGLLKKGKNVLRIDADNSEAPNSRWYSGAGIYRPLHLKVQDAGAYIDDVKVSTLSIAPATLRVETAHHGGQVAVRILKDGTEVARAEGDDAAVTVPEAALWSAEHPELYTAEVSLSLDGKVVEKQEIEFGIRILSWSGAEGFKVNGDPVLLKGGCFHHDNGVLGAAEYDAAAMRRIAILKQYGFNAVRSAHNPASEAILKACDRLGMYVMDELWDMWTIKKNKYDYANDFETSRPDGKAAWQFDMEQFVRKDFNHPSVIMYSIGNEVAEPATEEGLALEKQMVDGLHAMDATRPVTAGMNLMIQMLNRIGMSVFNPDGDTPNAVTGNPETVTSEQYNAMAQASGERMLQAVLRPAVDEICSPGLDMLDIAGYNYGNLRFDIDAQLHPDRVTVGSETYPHYLVDNWAQVKRIPNLIGDFMWTAWDHIGEVGIGAWYYSDEQSSPFNKPFPFVLSGAGALDLLGNPTGEAFLAKAIWEEDGKPYLTVRPIMPGKFLVKSIWRGTNSIPSWSWEGCEGETATVEVFTSAPTVSLFLNGGAVGTKDVEKYCATFEVPYAPGELKALTIGSDGTVQEDILRSATGKPGLILTPEKASYKAGDLIYIDVSIAGENGEVFSNLDRELSLAVEGADLLGFGSACPSTEDRFQSGTYVSSHGRAQAVLLCRKPGQVRVTASGEGLERKVLKMIVK